MHEFGRTFSGREHHTTFYAPQVHLASESKGLLVGDSADTQVAASIRTLAKADPAVESVQSPLILHFGPHEIPLNLEIIFRKGLSTVAEEGGANCTLPGDMASEAFLAAFVGA